MTSSPNIIDVSASKTPGGTVFLVLIENTGADGVVLSKAYNNYTGGACSYGGETQKCIKSSINPYITSLYQWTPIVIYQSIDYGCVTTQYCNSGDSCTSNSCTEWSQQTFSSKTNIPVQVSLGKTPDEAGNIQAFPGDKSISVSWNSPTNTSIFAYTVWVNDGDTTLVRGEVLWSRTSISISNLTNGKPYTFSIRPLSYDGYYATKTSTVTATPQGACPGSSCKFTIA